MKKFKVFEASHNADNIEGRGPKVVDAYFTKAGDAARAEKGNGVMGVGHGDVTEIEIVIYDTYEEYAGETKNKLRDRALKKLSPEEREALGSE